MPQVRMFFGLLLVFVTAACAYDDEATLSGTELEQIITGNRFEYSGFWEGNSYSGEMEFNENGNLYVDTDNRLAEGGTWKIQGNKLCTKLVSLRDGKENCFSMSEAGDNRYTTNHGFWLEGPLGELN